MNTLAPTYKEEQNKKTDFFTSQKIQKKEVDIQQPHSLTLWFSKIKKSYIRRTSEIEFERELKKDCEEAK